LSEALRASAAARDARLPAAAAAREVGLAEVLEARESRAARVDGLMLRWGSPAASLSLVSPGPVKDSPERRALMDAAAAALRAGLASRGLRLRFESRLDAATGPEAVLVVHGDAFLLKEACLEVEAAAPWGRLVDADVHRPGAAEAIRREALGASPRPCLVCGRAALECVSARRHGSGEAALAADRLFAAFWAASFHGSLREGRLAAHPSSGGAPEAAAGIW